MSDWNLSTGTSNTTKWTRSWRQELYTDLGSDFRIVLHMEEVTTLDSGEVIHKELPQVVRKLSAVSSDPDVVQLATLLTSLAKKWLDEDNTPVV
ncbi:MAG: hypothetical protein WCO84_05555 [bacterium]